MNILLAVAAKCDTGNSTGLIGGNSLPHPCPDRNTLNTAFLIGFSIIGALAFLFIVIAGTRYVFSKGEAENVQRAKNELKYAIIGLIITAMAAAFVNFVIGQVNK